MPFLKYVKTHTCYAAIVTGMIAGWMITGSIIAPSALAQVTVNLDINAEIIDEIVVQELTPLNFGTIGLTTRPGFAPTLTLGTNGSLSVAGEGGGASLQMITGHETAIILVDSSPSAAGLDVNLVISNPAALTGPGPSSFSLSNFTFDDQEGNSGNAPLSTPVTIQLGLNGQTNLLIGARLNTIANGVYADGVYSGSFDVEVYF